MLVFLARRLENIPGYNSADSYYFRPTIFRDNDIPLFDNISELPACTSVVCWPLFSLFVFLDGAFDLRLRRVILQVSEVVPTDADYSVALKLLPKACPLARRDKPDVFGERRHHWTGSLSTIVLTHDPKNRLHVHPV